MADLSDLPTLTAVISGELAAAGIRHVITGAMALAAHGYVRATIDLDIVVYVPSLRLPDVFSLVRKHGFTGDDAALIRSLRERYVAVLEGGKASVEIIVPAIPWHQKVLERAVIRSVEGRPLPFISPEDLIIQKLLWSRPKDLFDVRAFAGIYGGSLDEAYIRDTLRSLVPDEDQRHVQLDEILRLRRSRRP